MDENQVLLKDYVKRGKKLVPHMMTIPALRLDSWVNNRLPELLWAALIRSNLDQSEALSIFSKVGECFHETKDREDILADVRLSGIASLPQDFQEKVLAVVCTKRTKPFLGAMLVLDSLPGKAIWQEKLPVLDDEESWILIADAVLKNFNHQSDEATDSRAAKIIPMIAKGSVQIVHDESILEMIDVLHEYPFGNEDRTAHAQASIRSLEGGMAGAILEENQKNWADPFWEECFNATGCYIFQPENKVRKVEVDENTITELRGQLIHHSMETIKTTGSDPKHAGLFGMGFYGLNLLADLLEGQSQYSSSGRIVLRTFAEMFIVLKWLCMMDESELWEAFRKHGSGQAELQLEKTKESDDEIFFVDEDVLHEIANEDQWDKFLEIELGHWSGSNLRQLSIDAGVKQIYDDYYNWTSSFTHGGWGAIRESNIQNCANPLHRFHQIPLELPKKLPSVLPDAILLLDLILDTISDEHPELTARITKME